MKKSKGERKTPKRLKPKYETLGHNQLLRKPRRTRAKTIFQSVDIVQTHGARFLPTWDSTDHLKFACAKCHAIVDVLAVEFYSTVDTIGSALYFLLGCPECGNTGIRKTYLQTKDAYNHHTVTDKNEELCYASGQRTPVETIQLHHTKKQ